MKMKADFFDYLISVFLIILIIPGIMPGIVSAADGNDTVDDGNSSNELPDLIIEDLSFNPGNPEPGQTVTITATVKNQGNGTSGATNLAYYSDGSGIGESEVPEIEAGQNEQILFSWDSKTEEGTVEITAKVNEGSPVEESDENNNERKESLTFGLPDLVIDTFDYPENPKQEEEESIRINVKNQGTATSKETKLRLYIDGSLKEERNVPQLPSGESSSLESYAWTPISEGNIEIKAVVDEDNTTRESNEGNNQKTATVTVTEEHPEDPLPDLIIESIVPESYTPQIGKRLNFTVRVKNQGTAPAEAVMAKYYINDDPEGQNISDPILPLSEEATTNVVFSLTPDKEGEMKVEVFVDSGTAVYESNENNNRLANKVNATAIPPDLTIESLSVNPEAPEPEENITFTVIMKNNGPGASSRCDLKYEINGTNGTSGEILVPALDAGGTTTGTFFWAPKVEEQIEVKLMIDSGTAVREKDETNNELTKTVKVAKETTSSGSSGSSSSGSGSSSGSRSKSSSGGGVGGGSPEPAKNVKAKELSQVFITSGKFIEFEFPNNATAIVSLSFNSKKTVGKTTTIVEMLKNKSTLTPDAPKGEVYNYLNIWVGNGGYGSDAGNLENAVINFRVEKSWVQDKGVDKSSIILSRYNDKKWNELPTSLSGEDSKYLYFKAETAGFSPFAITGYNGIEENIEENKTQVEALIQENLKSLEDEGKSILNASAGKEGIKTKKPMGMAKILMAISLPLFMILIEYFILKKKL